MWHAETHILSPIQRRFPLLACMYILTQGIGELVCVCVQSLGDKVISISNVYIIVGRNDQVKIENFENILKNFLTFITAFDDDCVVGVFIEWNQEKSEIARVFGIETVVRGSSVAHVCFLCVYTCDDASHQPKIKLTIAKDYNANESEKFS